MRPLKTFQVSPALPARLAALEALAYNIRWSWDHETISLFRNLDRDLWETSGHNPVLMLGSIAQARLVELEQDEAFLAHLDRISRDLEEYLQRRSTWYAKKFRPDAGPGGGVLLDGVRPDRVPAHLLRRPRHARRRPPEVRQRPRACRWSASACSTSRATSAST